MQSSWSSTQRWLWRVTAASTVVAACATPDVDDGNDDQDGDSSSTTGDETEDDNETGSHADGDDSDTSDDGGSDEDTTGDDGTGDSDGRSFKRGAAYNFCDWEHSGGQADLDLLVTGTTENSGLTWYYNWGISPRDCIVESPDLGNTIEFVPMAWGLSDGGSGCLSGGACFVDGLSRDEFLARVPQGSRYILGFNEPNFQQQSGLTPTVAAQAWVHLEYVADAVGLEIVGPAVNFCDPSSGSNHGGSCTAEPEARTFTFPEYEETFSAGYRYNVFEWAELFYDECSRAGTAGYDCRIDHQAGHVYSYWSLDWFVTMFKRKAGIEPATAEHCSNGNEDADEFGVDCGGQECVACTDWSREQFAKSLWITEFAPSTDDAGSSPTFEQRIARTNEYIDTQIPLLEADDYIFRYAWFMPKTNIASLDHVDLLTESEPVERTSVGINYLDEPQ